MRSTDPPDVVVKNRSSSGCLIVRKKGTDVAGGSIPSGSNKVLGLKGGKKRPRLLLTDSDSDSSDEEPLSNESSLPCHLKNSEISKKRHRQEHLERQTVRKKNRLDVFEFNEYDRIDNATTPETGGRRVMDSMPLGRDGAQREYMTGSSRQHAEKRQKYYSDRNRLESDDEEARRPISSFREKFLGDPNEPIRLQGKNGVLKVMVNKNKNIVNRKVLNHPSYSSESRSLEKPGSYSGKQESEINLRKSLSARKSEGNDSSSEDSDLPPPQRKSVEARTYKRRLPSHEINDMPLQLGTKKVESHKTKKLAFTKNHKGCDTESDDSDTSLKSGAKNLETRDYLRKISSEGERTPNSYPLPSKPKVSKVKRGSGTEKQKLREHIREMLLNAGWNIDYRPRRNRDYLDAVYINPSGTAYWSIIKAYEALQKQTNVDEDEAKTSGNGSSFAPLSEKVLSQLTRKTQKKMEREMKKKQENISESENSEGVEAKKSASKGNNGSQKEKPASFIEHGGKVSKSRATEDGFVTVNLKGQSSSQHLHDVPEKSSTLSSSQQLQGKKSRKLGRCTLLVRNSNKGLNSETQGFTPYSGKRTLLSWLIDSGSLQLSQKVQYKNRRKTKAMLEGWATRDGIHCGCCSKILTVSKFEIHAGSKLRQPFQNIYLDSGISLLQCQIDAWNKQEKSDRIGLHSVNIDGDDPNDDTCGLCGDGGDLICCDGCPSTFHLSCLDIQMLPPGDWRCPYCACKFCVKAGVGATQENDSTVHKLFSCSLCEKKFHESCAHDIPLPPVDSYSSAHFCGKKCRELSENIQKYLFIKHELEGGYSWSLLHRVDAESDASSRGLSLRVECNSKLAIALAVMDECFLPIIDRRSGINLIRNVLYNCGSNFNRLNYNGFYTAILERGDEVISAASIRFHGTQLVEMPFIGTRDIYRRQGMCRRLFGAIEEALCYLEVKKMIIPAVAELASTWTGAFGFTSPKESLKQELRSMNVLVFPGIDMLQKLFYQKNSKENIASAAIKQEGEIAGNHSTQRDVDDRSVINSPKYGDGRQDSKTIDDKMSEDSDSEAPGSSSNASEMSNSLDSSHGLEILASIEKTSFNSGLRDKIAESVTSYVTKEVENKSISSAKADSKREGICVEINKSQQVFVSHEGSNILICKENTTNEGNVPLNADEATHKEIKISASVEENLSVDSKSGDMLSEDKTVSLISQHDAADTKVGEAMNSPVEIITQSFEGENTSSCKGNNAKDGITPLNVIEATQKEIKISASVEENLSVDSKSGDMLSEDKTASLISQHDAADTKIGEAMNSSVEVITQSFEADNTSSCKGNNAKDGITSLNADEATQKEIKISASVEENLSVDSKSGDMLSEDKTISLISQPDAADTKIGEAMNSSVEVITQPFEGENTSSSKGNNAEDGIAPLNVNEATSDELKIPGLVEEVLSTHSKSGDMLSDNILSCKEIITNDGNIPLNVTDATPLEVTVAGSVDQSFSVDSKSEDMLSESIPSCIENNTDDGSIPLNVNEATPKKNAIPDLTGEILPGEYIARSCSEGSADDGPQSSRMLETVNKELVGNDDSVTMDAECIKPTLSTEDEDTNLESTAIA